jgi:hypothetical protein
MGWFQRIQRKECFFAHSAWQIADLELHPSGKNIKTITNEKPMDGKGSSFHSGLFGSDDSDAGRFGNLLDLNVSRT